MTICYAPKLNEKEAIENKKTHLAIVRQHCADLTELQKNNVEPPDAAYGYHTNLIINHLQCILENPEIPLDPEGLGKEYVHPVLWALKTSNCIDYSSEVRSIITKELARIFQDQDFNSSVIVEGKTLKEHFTELIK